MPEIGDIIRAKDRWPDKVYNPPSCGYGKYGWEACPECGKERWVYQASKGNGLCPSCCARQVNPEKKASWKGGRRYSRGYILVWLSKEDPFFPMAQKRKAKPNGYVLEHRLVMAKHLRRCLTKQEAVHHLNGIKDDNRMENLELMPSPNEHGKFLACAQCTLRKEIRLLRWQLKEQMEQIRQLNLHLMGLNS